MGRKVSYEIVLKPNGFIPGLTFEYLWEVAKKLEYEFFCWNGILYRSEGGGPTSMTTDDVS